MKRKLFSIATILLLTASISMAQLMPEPRTSLGILGGVNFQNFNGKDFDGDALENDMIIGFHAGVNLQVPLAPEFYFEPGLLYSAKGAKGDWGPVNGTFKVSYIELPLNLLYKGMLGSGYIVVGLGPYLAYALNGSASFESGALGYDTDIRFQNSIEEGDPLAIYMRRFDAGANIFAGYEMGMGLFLRLNTQWGLLNLYPDNVEDVDSDARLANTGFGLSLGYRF